MCMSGGGCDFGKQDPPKEYHLKYGTRSFMGPKTTFFSEYFRFKIDFKDFKFQAFKPIMEKSLSLFSVFVFLF